MDKQKQVEEIEITQKAIRKSADGEGAFVDLLNQEMKELQESQKQIEELANSLYNTQDEFDVSNPYEAACFIINKLGYRKIPEGAVVLTRERYEELEKAVDSVQVAVSSFTRLETIYKIKCKELELAEEKARKETAEKFAERAKEEAFVVFMGEPIIRASKIDEIAKEITEGE